MIFFYFLNLVVTSFLVSFNGRRTSLSSSFEVALFVLFCLDTCLGPWGYIFVFFAENEMAAKRLCALIIKSPYNYTEFTHLIKAALRS